MGFCVVAIDTTFTIKDNEYVRAVRRHNVSQIQFFRDVFAGVLVTLGGGSHLLFTRLKIGQFC
jgi:hypothetical protein